MMKHYTYRLTVYQMIQHPEYGRIGRKIKGFIGNDNAELMERFEKWFIKQGYDREEIEVHIDNVQHANNI
ncbi:MAG: hypothetical protein J6V44_08830 [Methanobrevibacter sp.]|nr:hypothetical protein [Methanobrevibacter sp.]